MRRTGRVCAAAIIVVTTAWVGSGLAWAQEMSPAQVTSGTESGPQTLDNLRDNGGDGTDVGRLGIMPVVQMLFWLGLVLGLLYVTLRLVKKYVPAARGLFGNQVVKVIARTHVSPKQSMLLVKVGRRMVLVGATPGSMNVLAEIRDEEEMEEIRREVMEKGGTGPGREFESTLKEAGRALERESGDAGTGGSQNDETVGALRREIEGLSRKVSDWRRGAGE